MARQKHTNFVRLAAWSGDLKMEMQGSLREGAVSLFGVIRSKAGREAALKEMQERHVKLCALETQNEQPTSETNAGSS